MKSFLLRFQNQAYALLRIVSGLNFAVHGSQKILGLFGGPIEHFPSQIWVGGIIELFCGLATALGIKTRWAAFLVSGTMAVAYIQFHWRLRLGLMFIPTLNKGELALVYCFLFLYLATQGNGCWSVGKQD